MGERLWVRLTDPFGSHDVEVTWADTFGRVGVGQALLTEDSYGRLSLAINQGSAAQAIGIREDAEVLITRQQLPRLDEGVTGVTGMEPIVPPAVPAWAGEPQPWAPGPGPEQGWGAPPPDQGWGPAPDQGWGPPPEGAWGPPPDQGWGPPPGDQPLQPWVRRPVRPSARRPRISRPSHGVLRPSRSHAPASDPGGPSGPPRAHIPRPRRRISWAAPRR